LPLQKAITGFVNYKTAEGLSDRSIDSYKRILEHWAEFAGNKNVNVSFKQLSPNHSGFVDYLSQAIFEIPEPLYAIWEPH
jgi:hypothetical protein